MPTSPRCCRSTSDALPLAPTAQLPERSHARLRRPAHAARPAEPRHATGRHAGRHANKSGTNLAPLYWLVEVERLETGAQVLPKARHPHSALRCPHFPSSAFNTSAPAACCSTPSIPPGAGGSARATRIFARYWVQTIRFLARGKLTSGRGAQLTTDRREYRRGEAVRAAGPVPRSAARAGRRRSHRARRSAGPGAAPRDASPQSGGRGRVRRLARRFGGRAIRGPAGRAAIARQPAGDAVLRRRTARRIRATGNGRRRPRRRRRNNARQVLHHRRRRPAARRFARRPPRAHRKPAADSDLEPLVAAGRVSRPASPPNGFCENARECCKTGYAMCDQDAGIPCILSSRILYPHNSMHPLTQKIASLQRRLLWRRRVAAACWIVATAIAAALVLGTRRLLGAISAIRACESWRRPPSLPPRPGPRIAGGIVPSRRRLVPLASPGASRHIFRSFNDSLASASSFSSNRKTTTRPAPPNCAACRGRSPEPRRGLPLDEVIDRRPLRRAAAWLAVAACCCRDLSGDRCQRGGDGARPAGRAARRRPQWPRQHHLAFRNVAHAARRRPNVRSRAGRHRRPAARRCAHRVSHRPQRRPRSRLPSR